MHCARTSRKKVFQLFLLISALSVHAAPGLAQQPAKPRVTALPRLIILPPKVAAGAPATLAVLDSRGRLMPKVEVEISDGQKITTDVTGRALFNATNQPGPLVAKIEGRTISATTNVVLPETGAQQDGAKAITINSYPRVITQHDRFVVEGAGFRAQADSNQVSLNGNPCLVLASSPVSLVILPGPHVPIGSVNLEIISAGNDAGTFPLSVIALEFSGPDTAVQVGSTGKLILHARGTTLPLIVEIRNESPKVIRLTQGNVQRIKTSGGEQNIAPIDVNFVTDGNYFVSARLISAENRRRD